MRKQFSDYETASMLKELGMTGKFLAYYDMGFHLQPIDTDFDNYREINPILTYAPLWQQIKEWIHEKNRLVICVDITNAHDRRCFYVVRSADTGGIVLPEILDASTDIERFDSPITAEKEAIKNTVEYLYKTKNKSY